MYNLGLAPYTPEPHLWGKIKWCIGGGVGMKALDYFDLVLHVSPFVWFLWEVWMILKKISKTPA
jgi:hypothetical protein